HYKVIAQDSIVFSEGKDDDGDPSEDLFQLSEWVVQTVNTLVAEAHLEITKVNFSAYGATFVHLDEHQKICTPLYNYLKKRDLETYIAFKDLLNQFSNVEVDTGAAITGMLNTGFQLFWLKNKKPSVFQKIWKSVHLPQYFSFLFTGRPMNELTSLGCHTSLWDFKRNQVHQWLNDFNIQGLMPTLEPADHYTQVSITGKNIWIGNGIHDSSAALLPYKTGVSSPFMLISSGTWSIILNPFDQSEITQNHINQELIYYLQPDGKKVRASRLYYGKIYEDAVANLQISDQEIAEIPKEVVANYLAFPEQSKKILNFTSKQKEYTDLVFEMAKAHFHSLQLAKGESHIEEVYVDGGFAKNDLFLRFLATMLFPIRVFKAENPMGSALGAAIMMDQNSFTPDIFRDRYNLKLVPSHYHK
ncbi:MAG: FGGY family carbohydrate kinase, partial [Saprospiraceae bacterium]